MSVTSSGTYGLVKDSIRRHARIKEFFFKGFFPRGGGGEGPRYNLYFSGEGIRCLFSSTNEFEFSGGGRSPLRLDPCMTDSHLYKSVQDT